jgi:hypothetical protein
MNTGKVWPETLCEHLGAKHVLVQAVGHILGSEEQISNPSYIRVEVRPSVEAKQGLDRLNEVALEMTQKLFLLKTQSQELIDKSEVVHRVEKCT